MNSSPKRGALEKSQFERVTYAAVYFNKEGSEKT